MLGIMYEGTRRSQVFPYINPFHYPTNLQVSWGTDRVEWKKPYSVIEALLSCMLFLFLHQSPCGLPGAELHRQAPAAVHIEL